jgi:hypothetical protein
MATKNEDKVVSATLATGTKVTAPQSVIDKVNRQAERDVEASKAKASK